MTISVEIPENCMPVVEVLRRDVLKPSLRLEASLNPHASFPSPRFINGWRRCPMGLHATALSACPVTNFGAGSLQKLAQQEDGMFHSPTSEFADWWDSLALEQAKEAVDLIWPEAK
jgi:hypothetical protein